MLVEGPAGVGKTELAKAVAAGDRRRADAPAVLRGPGRGPRAVRVELQEAAAAHPGQRRRDRRQAWEQTHDDIFTDEFLLTRPLLTAIRREDPTVLLIDEADKTDVEVEALLLEVLSEFQVTIPELGTVRAIRRPFVVDHLERDPRAVRGAQAALPLPATSTTRRPSASATSCWRGCPGIEPALAEQLVRTAATLRTLELKKSPSVAETIDWARTLLALGIDQLDEAAIAGHARRRAQARTPTTRARPRSSACRQADVVRRPVRAARRLRRRAARGRADGLGRRGPRRGGARMHRRRPARSRAVAGRATRPRCVKRQMHRSAFDNALRPVLPAGDGASVAPSTPHRAAAARSATPPARAGRRSGATRIRDELRRVPARRRRRGWPALAREAVAGFGAVPGSGTRAAVLVAR